MIDLRETKKVKEALRANPENFAQIIEDTSLAICITNRNARFVTVNENYLKVYGYSREELIGKDFTIVVPAEQRDALKKYHDRFFDDKYEILRRWEVKNKKGEIMEIFADAAYHENIQGEACKITLVQFKSIISTSGGSRSMST